MAFPDWSVMTSVQASTTLNALLETAWRERSWRDQTAAEDRTRRAVLELYARLGHAPSVPEIARHLGMAPGRIEALLRRLARRDLVVLKQARIVGAYPLTELPTEHRVQIDGRLLGAMCAIDALGVGAMYRTATTVLSECRLCGRRLRIETTDRGHRLSTVSPADTIVWVGLRYEGACAATSLCTTIAFFCGDPHLEGWHFAHGLETRGFRLTVDEALQIGRALFGPVLTPPSSPPRSESS